MECTASSTVKCESSASLWALAFSVCRDGGSSAARSVGTDVITGGRTPARVRARRGYPETPRLKGLRLETPLRHAAASNISETELTCVRDGTYDDCRSPAGSQ